MAKGGQKCMFFGLKLRGKEELTCAEDTKAF